MSLTRIKLDLIGYDPQFYPRVNGKEDWFTVNIYVDALKRDPKKADARKPGSFPPVVLVKATGYKWPYVLIDGLHRIKAFGSAGYDSVWANVERLPRSKWLARSAELNSDSKRPLDTGDKRWIAKKLESEGYDIEKIAGILQMQTASLKKLMTTGITKLTASTTLPVGRSNRTIGNDNYGFLKSPFADMAGTGNATVALAEQGTTTSRVARQIAKSFVAMLDSKSVDLTDEELCDDLRKARDLLAALEL